MMTEYYIKLEQVRKAIDAVQKYRDNISLVALDLDADGVLIRISQLIDQILTADVAEVKHGKWKAKPVLCISTNPYIGNEYYQYAICSECGCKVDEVILRKLKTINFCPNCGAKMDGKRDDK